MEKDLTRSPIRFKPFPKKEHLDGYEISKLGSRGSRIVHQMMLNYENILSYYFDFVQAKELPRPLGKLKFISTLHVSFPDLELENDIIFRRISLEIKSLSSLQVITLQFPCTDWISTKGIGYLADILTQLKNLKKLIMTFNFGNWVNDQVLSIFFQNLRKFCTLQSFSIDVSHCEKITAESFKSIASAFKHLPRSLKELNFGFTGINLKEGKGLDFLASGMANLIHLQALKINFSQVQISSIDDFSSFMSSIKHLKSLKILDLDFSYQYMKFSAFKHLAPSFKSLKHLRTLSLKFEYCSTFKSPEMEILAQCLQAVGSSLKNLTLDFRSSHSLNDEILEKLSVGLKALQNLSEIKLDCFSCPHVGDAGVESVTYELGGLNNLQSINLNFRGCCPIKDIYYDGLKRISTIKNFKFDYVRF